MKPPGMEPQCDAGGMTLPNYEYRCTACDHVFEVWQPVGEAAPACPECGAVVKKVFHPPRVIFKGSGFYVTDLRAEKAGSASAKASKTSESASQSSEGTKTEGAKSDADKSVASPDKPAAVAEKTVSSDKGAANSEKAAPAKSDASSGPPSH